jgi:hypothetical protein
MKVSTDLCKLSGQYGDFKWPKLSEALEILCNHKLEGAHGALADSHGCLKLFRHLTAAGNGEAPNETSLESN